MKKVAMYLIMILVTFILVGCNQNDKYTNLKVDIGESINFSDEEINKAVDCLKSNFDFEACTLTKIYYDEKKSNNAVKDYLQFGKGLENKVKAENVIVLFSDFDVDGSGKNPVLEPNSTYTDYNWVLIRDNKSKNWKIVEWGY